MIISDQCSGHNCSFVSGEASNMYSLLFALALMTGGLYRRRLILAGIVAGMGGGVMRILQGGHFLSDIVYAGVFMWLTTVAIWWAMSKIWPGDELFKNG